MASQASCRQGKASVSGASKSSRACFNRSSPPTPEPIRSALLEGIGWWTDAYDAAGFIDAFRVEMLPEGADPLDVRYNMVNWVDRATRGWAYGQQIVDPRTGEIVKGMVVLGSLRARQDIQIFQALVGAAELNSGGPNDPVKVALDRLAQLGAHEVGHTLGFAHNFAASTQDRASVMDYPPPRIGLAEGKPDLSDAYAKGIGVWDVATVRWLYADAGERETAEAAARYRFVQDDNARAADTAQVWGGLWDDGADPTAELNRLMAVRAAALSRFGLDALSPAEPVANLRRRFVPLWLLHRYQLVAAAKAIGGVEFAYSVKGDGREAASPVAAAQQRAALDAAGLRGRDRGAVRRLSQGQRQRCALARLALSQSKPLWVLDEPFNALDTAATEWLAGLVRRRLASGGIVVLTSHQAVPVDGVADQITVAL